MRLDSIALLLTLASLPSTAQTVGQTSPAPQGRAARAVPCLPAIRDMANPANCVPASTIPAAGTLLPLGPEFFVAPTGEVGIGTMTPQYSLEVVGDLVVDGGVAFGNSASIGSTATWERLFDFSHVLTDFSGAASVGPMRSRFRLDPAFDLTGPNAKYFYSQDIIIQTTLGNDKDVEFIQGPYMLALHEGTQTVSLLVGALVGAENNHGLVDFAAGSYNVSIGDWESVTTVNAAAEFQSGHYGTTGSIVNDYGLYVYTPYTDGPLTNHYGIYLEDQNRGKQDSYAIYSAGGTTYLAGDLGLGTDTPTAKLEVVGDFVASGTKSFVQPHPTDASLEIRFVCLEGNEAGTYFRGRGRLVNGVAVIDVPNDFALVTEHAGLTVQLTARGPGADLWLAEDGLDRIVVRGARDVEFDYLVNGVRYGYADFQTIRPRASAASNASQRVRSPERDAARDALTRRMRDNR